jgi:hypothetical protein
MFTLFADRSRAAAFAIAADTPKGRFPDNLLAAVESWATAQDDRVDPVGNCPRLYALNALNALNALKNYPQTASKKKGHLRQPFLGITPARLVP